MKSFSWRCGRLVVEEDGSISVAVEDDVYSGTILPDDAVDLAVEILREDPQPWTRMRWSGLPIAVNFPKLRSQVTHHGWGHNNEKRAR